ncbi:hypothetical protein N8I77_010389 [Diaporthe amygdali]|uniref:Uncharacterized protein n=1 Tax=Phomopsis amygdali TaxID=1214568 RepID=A0AAD9S8B5_PHOAM|nr:hypothetical protein N8I77_010389 [Diaporthe amygdali]
MPDRTNNRQEISRRCVKEIVDQAVTVLRGFQVLVSTFDAILVANGLGETDSVPPYYPDYADKDLISKLLFSKIRESSYKEIYHVIIPHRTSRNSDTAYITYSWFMVYAQRELRDGDLPSEVPQAFEDLRKEIFSFSKPPNGQLDGRIRLYIVFTEENHHMPEEIQPKT